MARFTFALVLLVAGCASSQIDVRIGADEHTETKDGASFTTASVSPAELDAIVRAYAKARRLAFDFAGQRAHVTIPRTRDHLATVWYGDEIGKPTLTAKVGFDRRVIDHYEGAAECGLPEKISISN